jgi:putative spermidine/putrescine transport system permease protein
VLLILVLLPFWTSLMTRNFAWLVLLREGGPITDVTQSLGLGSPQLLGNVKGVVLAMSQILLPFMLLPLYATLRGIDRSLLSAAESLGARPWVAFVRVYMPLSLPGVLSGSLLVFVLSLGFFLTPAMIGSPQNSLLSQLIVVQVSRLLNWGHAGAMAMVLLVLTGLLIWIASVLARRSTALTSSGTKR